MKSDECSFRRHTRTLCENTPADLLQIPPNRRRAIKLRLIRCGVVELSSHYLFVSFLFL